MTDSTDTNRLAEIGVETIKGLRSENAALAAKLDAVNARIAELEELKCSVCGMRVAHLNAYGHVIGWGCANGDNCKDDRLVQARASGWDEGYKSGVEDERTSADNIGIAGFGMKVNPARENPYRTPAPDSPRPPAEEIERHTSVIADLIADIDRQRPIGSDGKHETAETASDPLEWEDASPSDYLFVLRNTAGKAAESLAPEVERAQAVLERLNRLADDAEDAAQLVAASDIEPNTSANVPERSGLTRREATDAE